MSHVHALLDLSACERYLAADRQVFIGVDFGTSGCRAAGDPAIVMLHGVKGSNKLARI